MRTFGVIESTLMSKIFSLGRTQLTMLMVKFSEKILSEYFQRRFNSLIQHKELFIQNFENILWIILLKLVKCFS